MNRIAGMFTNDPEKKRKLNRAIWWGIGILFVLQLYFVRELLAAELLFGGLFAVLFSIGFFIYMIGRAGERGFGWMASRSGAMAHATRRGFIVMQEISRRPFRHPRSESAQ